MNHALLAILISGCAWVTEAEYTERLDFDGDGYNAVELGGEDCDDRNIDVRPDEIELCDGIDNNCDGVVDEDTSADVSTWYADSDGDAWGGTGTMNACTLPKGFTASPGDCDDSDADINPGEDDAWYDGVDADCGGESDYDADSDGHDSTERVSWGTDCDDTDAAISPDATEVWYDRVDQDCDGASDDDADGDGFDSADYGGTDCDDTDAEVNPKATEVWYDGIDADCDGLSDYDADGDGFDNSDHGEGDPLDCDDTDETIHPDADEFCDDTDWNCDGIAHDESVEYTFYEDADSDGFGNADSSVLDCAQPSGYVIDSTDCDDERDDVNPDAAEVCDDEDADEDCDGLPDDYDSDVEGTTTYYPDADGDGWGDDTYPGDEWCTSPSGFVDNNQDCDDSDSSYSPDEGNCYIVVDLSDADASLLGVAGSDAGEGVSYVGDADGDGYDDIFIGAPATHTSGALGGAYLVSGPISGTTSLSSAPVQFVGAEASAATGRVVESGRDIDLDGFIDFAITAPNPGTKSKLPGSVYLINGPVTGVIDLSISDSELIGETASDYAGSSVKFLGDVNGDGWGDIAVGAYGDDSAFSSAGAVYLLFGPTSGDVPLSASDAKLTGESASSYAGLSLSNVDDIDGDGMADIAVGAPGFNSNTGALYIVSSAVSGALSLGTADITLVGEAVNDAAGIAVSAQGDVNDDGYSDVIVGANAESSGASAAGAAYVLFGPPSVSGNLSIADLKLTGEAASDGAGISVSNQGDFNDDGLDDLLIGAKSADGEVGNEGSAYVVLSPASGVIDLGSVEYRFVGEGASAQAGYSVAFAGDVNADGFDDVVIGARNESSYAKHGGAVYLIFGSSGP